MAISKQFKIELFSFGFKYGAPMDVNIIWDVRFLPNPYWVENLRPLTGKDPVVADYILKSQEGCAFMDHLKPMLNTLICLNKKAGKKSLRISIGCTGGRHRSVAVTEEIASFLTSLSVHLAVFHRDIDKDGKNIL